jgi:hypothetical protein
LVFAFVDTSLKKLQKDEYVVTSITHVVCDIYLDTCVGTIFVSFLQVAIIDPMKKRTARSGQGVPLGGIGYTFSHCTMCFHTNVECASVMEQEYPS